jgi:Lanthionine synthetase C-like protein
MGDIPGMSMQLFDPAQHRPLGGRAWSEAAARAAIEAIAADAVGAYRGPDRLWPNSVDDLESEPDVPYRNVYFGAAGMAWALDVLAREQLGPELEGLAELADGLVVGFHRAPELVSLVPAPAASLLFGESGILLAVEAIRRNGEHLDQLQDCIRRNAQNPTLELCWGSPGTMVAALKQWRATGDARWRDLWLDSADWLLDEWRETVWVQDLYGKTCRYIGAAHGFAGNAFVLLAGQDLLGGRGEEIARRAAGVLSELALEHDGLAQWDPLVGVDPGRRAVQWCHGSPGMITSLAGLPADDHTDRLLAAAGELTWRAGPLVKGVGLCHGTAGNAYAFLSLHARFGDERWLQRARTFAMDAAADVERRREATSRGRYTLFTGDIGVALLLRGCLSGDPTFPFVGQNV